MIKKRNANAGVNANISLEPSGASQSTYYLTKNLFIYMREEDIVITRDIEAPNIIQEDPNELDVKYKILETYAKILLDQDKALISNLISKNCIIVPIASCQDIIKTILGKKCSVEIYVDEDIKCCATKASPIRKIEAIKIVNEDGEMITDFKQVYNKEYNDLVNVYHLCLKYVVV